LGLLAPTIFEWEKTAILTRADTFFEFIYLGNEISAYLAGQISALGPRAREAHGFGHPK
jgi:hypothetical protein